MSYGKTLLFAVVVLTLGGCTTVYQVPPSLTPEQHAELGNSPYSQLVIGISTASGTHDGKYIPENVVDDLKDLFIKSRLFKEVGLTSDLSTSPDLIVAPNSAPPTFTCGTGGVSTMIITLGILPLTKRDNIEYAFSISNPLKSKVIELEFTFIAKSYVGSVSSLISVSPNWSTSPQDEKNYELFAYELVSRKQEIIGLISDR